MSFTKNLSPFHLAISVHNLELCRGFYGNILDMEEGRSGTKWVDFNFYGHQLVIHETAHTMCNHIRWRDNDHGKDFKHAEKLITNVYNKIRKIHKIR